MAWSPDGRWLASGSKDGAVRLWNEDLEHATPLEAEATVSFLAFSPDSAYLAASIRERNWVAVWSLESGERVATVKGHTQPVTAVAFVGDRGALWTAGTDGYVKIWDLR